MLSGMFCPFHSLILSSLTPCFLKSLFPEVARNSINHNPIIHLLCYSISQGSSTRSSSEGVMQHYAVQQCNTLFLDPFCTSGSTAMAGPVRALFILCDQTFMSYCISKP